MTDQTIDQLDAELEQNEVPVGDDDTDRPEVKSELSMLEQIAMQSIVPQMLNIANAAQQLSVELYDLVIAQLEADQRRGKLTGALNPDQLLAIDGQIMVVKAVRKLNRQLHEVGTTMEARAAITNIGGMAQPPVG